MPTRCVVAAVALIAISATPSAALGKSRAVKPTQQLAMLNAAHTVYSSPHRGHRRVTTVRASRPITGGQTALPVLGRATTSRGVRWLRVRLPGRPNGRRGWIRKRSTVLARTSWHLVVRTTTRRVLVYRHGRLVRSFQAIVGKPSTPTPHGAFFVEESVAMLPGSAGAPFALALSARSNVLQEFAGGPGQIALHGVRNVGGAMGTAASHGCIRLTDHSIGWLAARIAPGVPVTIRG